MHTYLTEGFYTVKLNIIVSTGGQGSVTKSNYIEVSEDIVTPFFYIVPVLPSSKSEWTSEETAQLQRNQGNPDAVATEFMFVDQTDANIMERYWIFDDGEKEQQSDPDIHVTMHTYNKQGVYSPTLLLVFADQTVKRSFVSPQTTIEIF